MTEHWSGARNALDAAQAVSPDPVHALEAARHLRAARDHVDALLNESLATAMLCGASLRNAADAAGMAANTVRPRLASTDALGPYATPSGVVTADGLRAARADQSGSGSMKFVPRRTTP